MEKVMSKRGASAPPPRRKGLRTKRRPSEIGYLAFCIKILPTAVDIPYILYAATPSGTKPR